MISAAEYRRQALDALQRGNIGLAVAGLENAVREDPVGAATGMAQKVFGLLGE
jgi:hypothetical protein